MSIDLETVDKLAMLSRLEFDDAAKKEIHTELDKILDFVSQLQQVGTDDVTAMSSTVTEASTPERDDDVTEENHRDEYMNVSPAAEMGFFVVPRVVE